MEPISAIVMSLALGAGTKAGETLISEGVKDLYSRLKKTIARRYPNADVDLIEEDPGSNERQSKFKEVLQAEGAVDPDVARIANELLELVLREAPELPAQTGVLIEDVRAANVCLTDIVSDGAVVARNIVAEKDFVLDKVRVGTAAAASVRGDDASADAKKTD